MKKEAINNKGMACSYCGSMSCKCSKMKMFIWGIIALILGILLWMGKLSLNMTIAIVLILKGLFCLMLSAKMKR